MEEIITRNYLVDERSDGIINIVDGSNLERNLYLTTQLLELHLPTVLAVNMMDIIEKNGDSLDLNALSQELGIPVIGLSAIKKDHTEEVIASLQEEIRQQRKPQGPQLYQGDLAQALAEIKEKILTDISDGFKDFYAVKLVEKDEKIQEKLALGDEKKAVLDQLVSHLSAKTDDGAESLITSARYSFIEAKIASIFLKKDKGSLSISDKIDKFITNRFFGLADIRSSYVCRLFFGG